MTDMYGIDEFSTLTNKKTEHLQGANVEPDIHADDIGIKTAGNYSGYLSWLSNNPSRYRDMKCTPHSTAGRTRSLDGLPFYDNEMPSYAIFSRCLSLDDKPDCVSNDRSGPPTNEDDLGADCQNSLVQTLDVTDSDVVSQNDTARSPSSMELNHSTESGTPESREYYKQRGMQNCSGKDRPVIEVEVANKAVQWPEEGSSFETHARGIDGGRRSLRPRPDDFWEQMTLLEDGIYQQLAPGDSIWISASRRSCTIIDDWDATSPYELSLSTYDVVDLTFLSPQHLRGEWWFGVLADAGRSSWNIPEDLPELRRQAGFFPARCARLVGQPAAAAAAAAGTRRALADALARVSALTMMPRPMHEVFRDDSEPAAGSACRAQVPKRGTSGPRTDAGTVSRRSWMSQAEIEARCSDGQAWSLVARPPAYAPMDCRAGAWPAARTAFAGAPPDDWSTGSATSSWDYAESVSDWYEVLSTP